MQITGFIKLIPSGVDRFCSEADGEADLRVELVAGMVCALVAVQVTLVDPPQTEVHVGANRQVCPRAQTHRIEVGKVFDEHAPVEHPHVRLHRGNLGEDVLHTWCELVYAGGIAEPGFEIQAKSQALDDVIIRAHPQDEIGLAERGSTPAEDRELRASLPEGRPRSHPHVSGSQLRMGNRQHQESGGQRKSEEPYFHAVEGTIGTERVSIRSRPVLFAWLHGCRSDCQPGVVLQELKRLVRGSASCSSTGGLPVPSVRDYSGRLEGGSPRLSR